MILRGWKGLGSYAGVHWKTVQDWHYRVLNVPFLKSAPGKGGKISIAADIFSIYLHALADKLHHTTKTKAKWTKTHKGRFIRG